MDALPEALPLALSAALYPPALLVLLLLLTSEHPRHRTVAYTLGAALMVVGAGLIALGVFTATGATGPSSQTASAGVEIAVGLALLVLGAWMWRRRTRQPDKPIADEPGQEGRIAQWSRRATTSQKWSFALGLAMFLPSPMYLLAVEHIADSDSSTSSDVAAVLICAAAVLIFLEATLVALFVRPGSVAASLKASQAWLGRNGWAVGSFAAFAVATYALAEGFSSLA